MRGTCEPHSAPPAGPETRPGQACLRDLGRHTLGTATRVPCLPVQKTEAGSRRIPGAFIAAPGAALSFFFFTLRDKWRRASALEFPPHAAVPFLTDIFLKGISPHATEPVTSASSHAEAHCTMHACKLLSAMIARRGGECGAYGGVRRVVRRLRA